MVGAKIPCIGLFAGTKLWFDYISIHMQEPQGFLNSAVHCTDLRYTTPMGVIGNRRFLAKPREAIIIERLVMRQASYGALA